MARAIHRLTSEAVEAISKPGRHGDGGGLYLSTSDDGRRRWVFLFTWRGKLREAGLGSASKGGVSLEEAREKAAEGRALVRAGIDPIAEWSRADPKGDDDRIIAWLRNREVLPHQGFPSLGVDALVRRLRSGEPLGERVSNALARALERSGPSQMTLKLEYRGRGRPPKDVRRVYGEYQIDAKVNAKIAAQEASGGHKPKRYLVEEEVARESGKGRSTVQAALKRVKARRARRPDE